MKKILGAVLTLVLCALPVLAQDWSQWQSSGWPQWLGPDRNGISPETDLFGDKPSFEESWRVQAGKGFSGLSIVGNRIYTMYIHSGEEYAVCLDASNGEVLWRTRTDRNLPERQGGDGPRATPTVDDGMVYVSSAYGKLYALDSQTGSQQWSHDLVRKFGSKKPRWGFCPSPLVAGDLVLIEAGGRGDHSLIAFDKTSGDVAWTTGSDKLGYSSPINATIGQTQQAVFFTGYGLVSVAPQHGKILWKHPWTTEHNINAATPVFIPPNRFFISSSYGTGGSVVEVSATDRGYSVKEVWRNKKMKNHFATSIYYQGHLYGFDNAILKCLDAETGEEKWKTRGYGKGTLIVADGHLVILGEQGNLGLAEAAPEGFVEKANTWVFRSKCWTVPSLADGRLYLRDDKEIVCLNVQGATQ
ncbi:MAG: PQQ-like beta-propeller repeat protein [Gemmatimonadota bacterium]|nr:PQQ-like beta-propeller repeat protein [Gemmatimonadota bacterium]